MAEAKKFSPIPFEVKEGELAGKYQIKRAQVNIPSVGIVTAADLAKDSKMLAHLVTISSGVIEKMK